MFTQTNLVNLKMKIFNFGSINIDHVYDVPHFVRAGETLDSSSYKKSAGGKGMNQSIALKRAGAEEVFHAGKIGANGQWLRSILQDEGVDISNIIEDDTIPTGHAIIQVSNEGENCILLFGGANQEITSPEIDKVLVQAEKGDIILLQNEINSVAEIINKSYAQDLIIAFNPAPFDSEINNLPLDKIHFIILNETEGAGLADHNNYQNIIDKLSQKMPHCTIILTLGAQGLIYWHKNVQTFIPAERVEKVVDTTAAGDTFIGYFLAEVSRVKEMERALRIANCAAAICVSRPGTAESIPTRSEVLRMMGEI
jgi:ribokinase